MARETEATLAPLVREVVVEIIKRKLSFVSIIEGGRRQAAETEPLVVDSLARADVSLEADPPPPPAPQPHPSARFLTASPWRRRMARS